MENIDGNSNEELKKLLTRRFEDMLWQTLTFMEISFPHKKGDGSENEASYNTIRSKILRIGNDNIRELDNILDSFIAFKLFDYAKLKNPNIDVQIFNFKSNWKIKGKEKTDEQGNKQGI